MSSYAPANPCGTVVGTTQNGCSFPLDRGVGECWEVNAAWAEQAIIRARSLHEGTKTVVADLTCGSPKFGKRAAGTY